MTERFPPCPYLPEPREQMDWRDFNGHGDTRDAEFYRTALEYGHYLWRRGFAARAILCLDRAMGADLTMHDSIVKEWPIPYAAMAWFIANTPADVFIGNPRVHFQHYADRLKEPRREIRRARAWACWAITRRLRPMLSGDPRHRVVEPSEGEIGAWLDEFGLPGEQAGWRAVLEQCAVV